MTDWINGSTAVYGILGHPVKHSLSPRIHNAAFRHTGHNGVYVPFDVANPTPDLKRSILDLNLRGLSVTIPHKTLACSIADERDPLSNFSGASNTLIRRGDRLVAANTDGPGALRALRESTDLTGRRIMLLGYGGSALSIAHAILIEGSARSITVAGRSGEKIRSFTEELRRRYPEAKTSILDAISTPPFPSDIDIIINTTPAGMDGDPGLPLSPEFLFAEQTVFDIVYVPHMTPLLTAARERGARIVPGYLMLLYQAVLQFELFTGIPAPVDVMKNELLLALSIDE
jgi:shikimate dehydrogenase